MGCLIFAILGIVTFLLVTYVGLFIYVILPVVGVVLLIALVQKFFGKEIESFLGNSKERSAERQRFPQGANPGVVAGRKLMEI